MESLLAFAAELERRDAEVARSLAAVERLQAEVDDVRARGDGIVAFLASLPQVVAAHRDEERAALAARAEAQTALRLADDTKDDQEAARARQQALDSIASAERWIEQARGNIAAAELEGAKRTLEGQQLAARAAELAAQVSDVPMPSSGLAGTIEWASQARGALLLERSNLAREREAIIREANELAAGVLGEPLISSAVAGLRDRLARALDVSSP